MVQNIHTYCCEAQSHRPNDFGVSRRGFIQGLVASAGMGLSDISFANVGTDARFILIVLRGGMDGLNTVVPFADSYYAKSRKSLAYDRPNDTDRSVLDLDGYFGLHPALRPLHGLYAKGEMAFVPATATPYRNRSHFDGQDMFENGSNMALGGPEDGWLNRTLRILGDGRVYGLSMGKTTPYVMRGTGAFLSLNPELDLHGLTPDVMGRLQRLYAGDTHPLYGDGDLARALSQAMDSSDLLHVLGASKRRRQDRMKQLAEMAGKTLAMPDGPRIASMSIGGWDTHADQDGLLADNISGLAEVIRALKENLGKAWRHTTVACVSEFGRTVHINGTDGTDHGTAGCAILVGGALNGQKIYGKWPGLHPDALYEGRDVMPTSDVRSLLGEILYVRFGISIYDLETKIFPSLSYMPLGVVS